MLLPKIGKHKEFEQLLLAEIQTHPAHYSLRLMLYGFYTNVGRKEDAKNALLNAITFFPNKVDLRYYLANIYFLNKEYTDALSWIENCLIDIPLAENGLKLKANILAALGKKKTS
jgi:predicted Zn-dependent protease